MAYPFPGVGAVLVTWVYSVGIVAASKLCDRPKPTVVGPVNLTMQSFADVQAEISKGAYRNSGMVNWHTNDNRFMGPQHTCAVPLPKIFHWIWLGGVLPQKYRNNIEQVMKVNPAWTGYLWVDVLVDPPHKAVKVIDWREFHKVHPFVNADIIEKEQNLGGKSDTLRLEVVYKVGGMYIDTDTQAAHPLDSFGDVFRWPIVTWVGPVYSNLCNCMFAFRKHSPFLKYAIDAARENCLKFRTCGTGSGAGPGFLTGAILTYKPQHVLYIHQKYLIVPKSSSNVMYQTLDATWL